MIIAITEFQYKWQLIGKACNRELNVFYYYYFNRQKVGSLAWSTFHQNREISSVIAYHTR